MRRAILKEEAVVLKRRRGILVLLAILGVVSLLLACAAGEEEEATPTPAPGETPTTVVLPTATPLPEEVKVIPGGILRGYTGRDPPYWSPNMGTSGETSGHLNRVHMELFQFHYGPGYEYWDLDINSEEGLVTSWETSADGLTWTLHLRPGVKWQNKPPMNGREWVAEDVKWTLETHMDTPGSPRRTVLNATIESIECPDKSTVVLKLKGPQADMLWILANPYIPMLAPELATVTDLNSPEAVVGLGPFMLEEYTPNVRIVYKKNPDYYRADEGLPYLDGARYPIIADTSTRLAAFRAENVDISGVSRIDLDSVKQTNPDIYCYEREVGLTHMAMAFRSDKAPFDDVRVRQAVSMALDRQMVIDTFYYGYGMVQKGPIHAGSPWYLEDQGECDEYNEYDPEEAKRLLAEAGYPDGFETTLNCCGSWGSTYLEYVEFWADSLSKIGITATIKASELGAHYTNRLCKYEGMVYTYDWGGATFGPYSWLDGMYLPQGGSHFGCVDDTKLTEMIEAERAEMDPVKRQAILDDLQEYAACQQYYVQWPMVMGVTCMQPWVRNYYPNIVSYHSGRYLELVWLTEDAPGRET